MCSVGASLLVWCRSLQSDLIDDPPRLGARVGFEMSGVIVLQMRKRIVCGTCGFSMNWRLPFHPGPCMNCFRLQHPDMAVDGNWYVRGKFWER